MVYYSCLSFPVKFFLLDDDDDDDDDFGVAPSLVTSEKRTWKVNILRFCITLNVLILPLLGVAGYRIVGGKEYSPTTPTGNVVVEILNVILIPRPLAVTWVSPPSQETI